MLSGSVGEGTISVGTGYMMKFIVYEMIFFMMLAVNLIALINHYKILKILKTNP